MYPLLFCLSGGIDSAFLASLAVKEFNQKLKPFPLLIITKNIMKKEILIKLFKTLNAKILKLN